MADATLKDVMDYFKVEGDTLKSLRDEWVALSDEDKRQIRAGIGNGSYTY